MSKTKPIFFDHFKHNEEIFKFWIRTNERLLLGMDILKPLIEPFKQANPNTNLRACQDCIIDMLVWANKEYKEYLKSTENAENKIHKGKRS